jgi:alkylation response protein AidB-like acyl-CoA dehydrogenase
MLTLTHAADVAKQITALLPELRSRRAEIEQARRMPRDLVDRLERTGLFTLGVPRALGGLEAALPDAMRAIETIAAADGSAGWTAMIGLSGNMAAGYMREDGARDVFGEPTRPTAGLAAPAGQAVRVDGGVRVSGRWPFASGITHCDWVWAGCLVMENGQPKMTPHGPEIVHAWMPAGDITIHDTWHVSGLCGTGSNDFSASNVFVPDRRLFALLDPTGHRREPLYQVPPLSMFVMQLTAVSLGIGRAALEEFKEIAPAKTPTMYTSALADKAVTHVELARAEAAMGAARAFVYAVADDIWRTVGEGVAPSPRQLADVRLATMNAVATAAAVTRTVNTLAGGSAIYISAALQRHARDAEAVTHHFTVSPHVWEEAGRVLLGRPTIVPVF